MTDKRLIDANALVKSFQESYAELQRIYDTEREDEDLLIEAQLIGFVEAILRTEDAPTIDAVPVVRCVDCAYKEIPKCCPCQLNGFKVTYDWYCPMGVRKTDAKE